MKLNHFGRASSLVLSLAIASHAGQAVAQNAAADDGAAVVEEVIVTGSFITREDSVLPVDVVGAEELSQRGMPTMVQLIKTIPSSGSVLGENNRFGGGNGISTINLRNLGAARTLVLLNGRRLGSSTRGGAPDVNSLPSNAIQRVEVLKDGAAATYGSDAIGGVVNFITRTDLNGWEFSGQYQVIEGSDGDYNLGAAWGWKGDSANILLSANYRGRSELPVAERDWALLQGYQGFLQNPGGGWAPTGNPGLYNTSTVAPTGSPSTGFTGGAFQTNTANLMDIGCAAVGGAPFAFGGTTVSQTSCAFQYTAFDNLVEIERNLQLWGHLNADLTDTTSFHAELMYSFNETPHQSWAVTGPNQWPTPMVPTPGVTNAPGGGVTPIPATGLNEQSRFYIPNTNPGLVVLLQQLGGANCNGPVFPYGVDAASCATGLSLAQAQIANAAAYGLAPSQTSWRPFGFAGDPSTRDRHTHYSYRTDTFRVQGSFKGTIFDKIGWEVSSLFSQIDYEATLRDLSVNRLQMALSGYGSKAGAADQCTLDEMKVAANAGNAAVGCYYFNPFANSFATSVAGDRTNPYYVASSTVPGFNDAAAARGDVYQWMSSPQHNHNTSRLFVMDAIFNGDTGFNLAAEESIAWAAGVQYRYDRSIDDPDPIYDSFATPCVDSPPFGDGAPFCPGTGNGPFLFNANNRPYDVDRKIYAAFAEFRVPVTDDLVVTLAGRIEEHAGLGRTTNPKVSVRWQAMDWLAFRGSAGSTYRAPNATQTQDGFNRGLVNANGTWRANDTFGNPNLRPETADTVSVGAIFDFGRIRAQADYWTFKFDNPITTISSTDLVTLMFPGGAAAPLGNCSEPGYEALRDKHFVFAGPCNRNNITSYKTQFINGGAIETSGIDFQVNADVGSWNEFEVTAGVDGTWLEKYDESPYAIEGFLTGGGVTQERAGTFRASAFLNYAEWRVNAFLNVAKGNHNLRWQTRYVSKVDQIEPTPITYANTYKKPAFVDEYFQHDLVYRLDIPDAQAQLSLGVQNVFDEEPPFAIGMQYNYDPSTVNPLGRVYSIGLKKQF